MPEIRKPSGSELKMTAGDILKAIQEFGRQYAPAIPVLVDMLARLAK